MTRLYLRPGLGWYRLDRLSVVVVQSWLNSRLAAGDSVATVHVMRNVLGAALTRAMREELVSRNVARLATLPPDRPARQQPWSVDEARACCDTELLARQLSAVVPYAIGMRQPGHDKSAIRFSRGFYQALAAGESIDDAFRLGVIQLRVAPIGSDASAPVLFRLVTGHSR